MSDDAQPLGWDLLYIALLTAVFFWLIQVTGAAHACLPPALAGVYLVLLFFPGPLARLIRRLRR